MYRKQKLAGHTQRRLKWAEHTKRRRKCAGHTERGLEWARHKEMTEEGGAYHLTQRGPMRRELVSLS